MIALNLKVYAESMGKKGFELCKIAEQVSEETGVKVIVAPQSLDLARVVAEVGIPVFAQHVDPNEQGAHTGTITLEAIKDAGCKGTLINHSEHKIMLHDINNLVVRAKKIGLESLVCTANAPESAAVAALLPNYIAVEPPELIGSGISVSTAKPEVVTDTIKAVMKVSNTPVLCGAGISNGGDVKKSMELGAKGVLLASAYVRAKDPKKLLTEMANGAK